jgi:hypothetical protein
MSNTITPTVGIGVTGKVLASGLEILVIDAPCKTTCAPSGTLNISASDSALCPKPGECARIEIRNAWALTFTKPRRIDTQGPATPAILLRR